MKVVLQDRQTYGEFYSGDSYIILHVRTYKLNFTIYKVMHMYIHLN